MFTVLSSWNILYIVLVRHLTGKPCFTDLGGRNCLAMKRIRKQDRVVGNAFCISVFINNVSQISRLVVHAHTTSKCNLFRKLWNILNLGDILCNFTITYIIWIASLYMCFSVQGWNSWVFPVRFRSVTTEEHRSKKYWGGGRGGGTKWENVKFRMRSETVKNWIILEVIIVNFGVAVCKFTCRSRANKWLRCSLSEFRFKRCVSLKLQFCVIFCRTYTRSHCYPSFLLYRTPLPFWIRLFEYGSFRSSLHFLQDFWNFSLRSATAASAQKLSNFPSFL